MLRGFANWAASRQCDMFPNRPDKLAGHKNGKSLFPNFKKTDLARKKGPRHLPRPKRKENRPPTKGTGKKASSVRSTFYIFYRFRRGKDRYVRFSFPLQPSWIFYKLL